MNTVNSEFFSSAVIQYVNLQTACIIIPINTQSYFIYFMYINLQRKQNLSLKYVEDKPFVY